MINSFEQIANFYEDHRPDYPKDLLEKITTYCTGDLDKKKYQAIDVGSGTGISTRQLRAYLGKGWDIIGLEPGDGMITTAQETSFDGVSYIQGTAENLPFQTNSIDLILVAQAIQWFERPKFYREALRVLEPGASIAVLQNNRLWQASKFLEAYESLLEDTSPGYSRDYRSFDIKEEIQKSNFTDIEYHGSNWELVLNQSSALGLFRSSSKFKKATENIGKQAMMHKAKELISNYQTTTGLIKISYQAQLYLGKKPH